MPLSENGNTSLINALGPMRYADTGERYPYNSYSVTLGDPMLYVGTDGRRIIPASEFVPMQSELKNLTITLEEAKQWLKVEHAMEDLLITNLIEAAKEEAGGFLNRDWEAGKYPASVRVDVLNIIAYRFEHRGDDAEWDNLPPIPLPGLNRYRLLPGL